MLALLPINHKGRQGAYLMEIGHAYLISKAVNMPSVKMLYDFWHEQIHAGDLIENLDLAWDEIGNFQTPKIQDEWD